MDVVEFYKEKKRMCETLRCAVCPLYISSGCHIPCDEKGINEMVKAVEKWSKENRDKD